MSIIYRNGRTLDGEPIAFAVDHARFVEVAQDIDVPNAEDLGGATVLPGFVDAHCHILPTGLDMHRLHLGDCSTPEQALDAVRDRHKNHDGDEWLAAVHYDQTRFPDGLHMGRDDLDAISKVRPIILRHVNGHASVVNTAALKAAGIDDSTEDPKGGTYVRDNAGRLTGVLLERAHEHVSAAAPEPSVEQMTDAIKSAAKSMSRYGITAASDMMTGYCNLEKELEAYRLAAEAGAPVRLRLYLQWSPLFGPRALDEHARKELTSAMEADFCKVAGAKIFADGAIASATAAIHGEFTTGGNGQLIYSPDRLTAMVAKAHDAGWPVSVHSIGDRSTDHVLDAFEATGEPNRHRIEHAMILSDGQIDRLAKINCHVAMQPEFLMRLGHAYRRQLQPDVSKQLKRAKSCLDKGVRLSFNSDRPVVAGNPWDGINTAAERPEGFDPQENVTLRQALALYTEGGADANGELGLMGEIAEGCFADFQVYRSDPTKSPDPRPDEVYMGGELRSQRVRT
ncbi:MAG: amidohydrolase [Armatimonadetes bacterium]|nr:amidohydrolase [Armatimonadota bacterium]